MENVKEMLNKTLRQEKNAIAAAVLRALAILLEISPDETMIRTARGFYLPGGEVPNAIAGVSLFLSMLANRQGVSPEVSSALGQTWAEQCAAVSQNLEEVITRGVSFVQDHREILGLVDSSASKYYDQIYNDREALFHHSPYALEEKLSKAVTRGDRICALETLAQINRQDKAVVAKDPLRSAKNSMIGTIAILSRSAIQAGVNADKAFSLSDSLIQHIEDMTSRKAVLAFEERILLQFIDLVNVRLENQYSGPITRVVHYIENHLNQKITLQEAAEYADIHPAYLSGRFSMETGMGFVEYVALRKIQESTYFICHTHYPISQIALLYGFSSQSYYITTFRRIMGVPPGEYRRRYLAD